MLSNLYLNWVFVCTFLKKCPEGPNFVGFFEEKAPFENPRLGCVDKKKGMSDRVNFQSTDIYFFSFLTW